MNGKRGRHRSASATSQLSFPCEQPRWTAVRRHSLDAAFGLFIYEHECNHSDYSSKRSVWGIIWHCARLWISFLTPIYYSQLAFYWCYQSGSIRHQCGNCAAYKRDPFSKKLNSLFFPSWLLFKKPNSLGKWYQHLVQEDFKVTSLQLQTWLQKIWLKAIKGLGEGALSFLVFFH